MWTVQTSVEQLNRYQKRISGPLLDRIDIHAEVPRVEWPCAERAERQADRRPVGRSQRDDPREGGGGRQVPTGISEGVTGRGNVPVAGCVVTEEHDTSTAHWTFRLRVFSYRQLSL